MEKNTLIAIVLSIIVLIGFQFFIRETTPPPPAPQQQETAKADQKAPESWQSKSAPTAAPAAKPATNAPEKTITVENDFYKIVLSSRGATIKQLQLKQYRDDNGAPIIFKTNEALAPLAIGLDEGFQYAGTDFSVVGSDIKLDSAAKSATL